MLNCNDWARQARQKRSKTFENFRKMVRNVWKYSKSDVKRLKIFENIWKMRGVFEFIVCSSWFIEDRSQKAGNRRRMLDVRCEAVGPSKGAGSTNHHKTPILRSVRRHRNFVIVDRERFEISVVAVVKAGGNSCTAPCNNCYALNRPIPPPL